VIVDLVIQRRTQVPEEAALKRRSDLKGFQSTTQSPIDNDSQIKDLEINNA
jgi:hypothetical protein